MKYLLTTTTATAAARWFTAFFASTLAHFLAAIWTFVFHMMLRRGMPRLYLIINKAF